MDFNDIVDPDFSSSDESDAQTVARLIISVESEFRQSSEAASGLSATDAKVQRTVQALRLSLLTTQMTASRQKSDSDADATATVVFDSDDNSDSASREEVIALSSAAPSPADGKVQVASTEDLPLDEFPTPVTVSGTNHEDVNTDIVPVGERVTPPDAMSTSSPVNGRPTAPASRRSPGGVRVVPRCQTSNSDRQSLRPIVSPPAGCTHFAAPCTLPGAGS
ncbi:hypothetical protein GN244_ATG18852 [Phytophthora infestans]|uniref:Uncharacterized protein n=1 Tax=Phytophthora infestans TaxID=4787 RepID=A0A833SH97_PHYIN|nr:hypothetical protein GN244_ATG18852 [Phytophthora infestans]KAF4138105.1 hypothetical protein GN958_ATG12714 [Phytophthora infestans]